MNASNPSPVKTLQVTVAALIMGVLVFGGIVVSIMDWRVASASLTPLAIAAWAILVATAGMAAVVPGLVFKKIAAASRKSNVESTEPNDSHKAVQTKTIVRYAILDMGAFVGLIATFLESNFLALSAAVVALALMVAFFPTTSRVESDLHAFREEVRHAK